MSTLADNHVTELLKAGADAMSNMFDVQIIFPEDLQSQLGPDISMLRIRAKGFEPPVFNVKTYEVKYKTISITRPATQLEGSRTFSLSFRVDAYYSIYKALKMWASRIGTGSTGYASNALWGDASESPNGVLGTVRVAALSTPVIMDSGDPFFAQGVNTGYFSSQNSETSPHLVWEFYDVWLQKLEEPKYSMDDASALEVQATFFFGNYKDPFYTKWRDLSSVTTVNDSERG